MAATGVGAGDLAGAAFAGMNLGVAVLWAVAAFATAVLAVLWAAAAFVTAESAVVSALVAAA